MDIIDALLTIEDQITTWIFTATPANAQDQAAMTKVLAFRDKLAQATNTVVLHRTELAAHDLQAETTQLNALSARLEGTAKTIGTVNDVISIAASVVTLAVSIAGLFA
jgi:hypothetical protein